MRLALDTAFSACSAALSDATGRLLAQDHRDQRRGQAETLVPMIDAVLKKAGVTLGDVSEIVVCTGPGTFAGVRIGTAFARAAALANGARVLGINSFEALAHTAAAKENPAEGASILALVPGKRGEVSAALFKVKDKNVWPEKDPETMALETLRTYAGTGALLVCGPDLDQMAPAINQLNIKKAYSFWPTAIELLEAAKTRKNGFSNTVSPFYLRPPDAKVQKTNPFFPENG